MFPTIVPEQYFFHGLREGDKENVIEIMDFIPKDTEYKREAQKLLKAYFNIEDYLTRKRLRQFLVALEKSRSNYNDNNILKEGNSTNNKV